MGKGLQYVVIAGLVQLGVGQGVGQGLGSIRGTVVDIGGNAVGGVSIEASPLHGPVVGRVPTALTDMEGKFELAGVPEGEVQLYAAKEAAGYPNTWASIFLEDENAVPHVIVMGGRIVSDVRVVLPPKCGVLTGVVRDAETNLPIMAARISLHRDDKPLAEYSASIDGVKGFVIALPDEHPHLRGSDVDAHEVRFWFGHAWFSSPQ